MEMSDHERLVRLMLFPARAIEEATGFIVLDDPVLTSDNDFRPNFASIVIEELLAADMQIIVLTQDHASCRSDDLCGFRLKSRRSPLHGNCIISRGL